ncbi:hypothetical protein [Phenylobacterium sp.]|uniref:hypothetical protein n=1 Tax=Phenylobacterium sp. TaxID=1871053 RepID=UPI0025CF1C4F|nr:hypothetical protein [Phenylobacterium sp.]
MTAAKGVLGGASYMVGAAILAFIGWAVIKGLLFLGHPLAAMVGMAVVAGGGIGASLLLRSRLDEVGRSAERFAWYWGGGGATVLTMLALLVYVVTGAPWLDLVLHGAWSRVDLICLGALGLAATQVMGFALVGAGWWLRRR